MVRSFLSIFATNNEHLRMKLRLSYVLLLLTFATVANADNLGYTAEKPLLFGIDQDYPPLEYVDQKGEPSGVDVEFAKLLMKRLDIPVAFKPNKWAAIAGDVMQGSGYDGVFALS